MTTLRRTARRRRRSSGSTSNGGLELQHGCRAREGAAPRRDPRVSLIVVDPQDQYRWLAISGRAEVTTDGADAQIDKLAKKYLGQDEYPWRKPEEQRITVRIQPEHIDSYGLDSAC